MNGREIAETNIVGPPGHYPQLPAPPAILINMLRQLDTRLPDGTTAFASIIVTGNWQNRLWIYKIK